MSIMVEVDEDLLKSAKAVTNIHDPSQLFDYLMKREIRIRNAVDRLAAAGGTMPELEIPPRKRHLESA